MISTWWVSEGDLDEDQKRVISISEEGNHLVTGPPGSGKTNILLLRAKYLTLAGKPNVVIVTFNRTLKRFINLGGADYGLDWGKVKTSSQWHRDILSEYEVAFEKYNDFQRQRIHLNQVITDFIAQRNMLPIYDAILLDEAQDFNDSEIAAFSRLGRQVFAVADSRQQVYSRSQSDLPVLTALRANVDQEHNLRYHYRNGMRICMVADGIASDQENYQPLVRTCQYNEVVLPSTVNLVKGTLEMQTTAMIKSLRNQLQAYPGELIGVIAPRRGDALTVYEVLASTLDLGDKVAWIEEDSEAFTETKPICVSTIHGAKGLEMRALHIMQLGQMGGMPRQRNLLYTGVTRAKTSLTMYGESGIPGWLESAYSSIDPPETLPELKALFGGC